MELNGDTFHKGTHNTSLGLFVMFYSPKCSACDSLARDFEAVAETFRHHDDVAVARLNVDSFADESLKYSHLGTPAFVSSDRMPSSISQKHQAGNEQGALVHQP